VFARPSASAPAASQTRLRGIKACIPLCSISEMPPRGWAQRLVQLATCVALVPHHCRQWPADGPLARGAAVCCCLILSRRIAPVKDHETGISGPLDDPKRPIRRRGARADGTVRWARNVSAGQKGVPARYEVGDPLPPREENLPKPEPVREAMEQQGSQEEDEWLPLLISSPPPRESALTP
jgi:hypothetical protein